MLKDESAASAPADEGEGDGSNNDGVTDNAAKDTDNVGGDTDDTAGETDVTVDDADNAAGDTTDNAAADSDVAVIGSVNPSEDEDGKAETAVAGEAETEDTQAEEACGGKQDESDPTGNLGTDAVVPKDDSREDTEETTGDAQEEVQPTSRPEGDTEPTDDAPDAAEPMEDGQEEQEHAGSPQESKEPETEAQEEKKAEGSPKAKADRSGEDQEEMEVSKDSEASKGEQADVSKGKRERSSDGDRRERRESDRRSDDSMETSSSRRDERRSSDPNIDEAIDPDEPKEEIELPEDDFQEKPEDESVIILDRFNSDLHFNIASDGLGGCGRSSGGFAYLWAGARATWGVKGGRYGFECTVEENVEVDLPEKEENPHVCRVGFSKDGTTMNLGEASQSYGFGGTSKAITNSVFVDYGESFGPGDVIGCFVDFEGELKTISFSKNGTVFGTAFVLSDDALKGVALFPHVMTKNIRVTVNFGGKAFAFDPPEGYSPIQQADKDHLVQAKTGPKSKEECEVIMMVGLPSAGKTTWALKHHSTHSEKRYTFLGTKYIMDKMRVSGLGRRGSHERMEKLNKQAKEILGHLIVLASRQPRNYIIDQDNVYNTTRRKKMSLFEGFKKKACACIVSAEERRRRERRREDNSEVPLHVLRNMQAHFSIPKEGEGEIFDEVIFGELGMPDAERIVEAGYRWARGDMRKRPYPPSSTPPYKKFRGSPEYSRYGPPQGGRGSYYSNYGPPPRSGGYGSPYSSHGYHGNYGPPRSHGNYQPYGGYSSHSQRGGYGGHRGGYGSPRGGGYYGGGHGGYGGHHGSYGGRGGYGGSRGGRDRRY